jgi:hypothetical protein
MLEQNRRCILRAFLDSGNIAKVVATFILKWHLIGNNLWESAWSMNLFVKNDNTETVIATVFWLIVALGLFAFCLLVISYMNAFPKWMGSSGEILQSPGSSVLLTALFCLGVAVAAWLGRPSLVVPLVPLLVTALIPLFDNSARTETQAAIEQLEIDLETTKNDLTKVNSELVALRSTVSSKPIGRYEVLVAEGRTSRGRIHSDDTGFPADKSRCIVGSIKGDHGGGENLSIKSRNGRWFVDWKSQQSGYRVVVHCFGMF